MWWRGKFRSVLLTSLALVLCACQMMTPGTSTPVDNKAEETVQSVNPYLQNREPVKREAADRFAAAVAAMKSANWAGAESDLRWLTTTYPQYSGPWLNLAEVFVATDRPKEAESAYRKAIAINPSNIGAYNQLGIFLRAEGRFDEAEKEYKRALAVWPQDPVSHKNLAILYDLYMGRLTDAARHYERYLALVDGEDRQVEGWLVDLQRRIQSGQAS